MGKPRTADLYYNLTNPGLLMRETLLGMGIEYMDFRKIHELVSLPMSMFRYKNLDKVVKGLDSKTLETALMFRSKLCFYESKMYGWVLACYSTNGQNDIYEQPEYVNLTALNGSRMETSVPYKDIIRIKDNVLDLIAFLPISEYIRKISYLENCLMVITNNASLPLVLTGNKKSMIELKAIANKIGLKQPYIYGDNKLTEEVQTFDIPVPVSPLDIYDLMKKYKNECLSSFGIYSVEEKRERIVTQELVNQNDYTDFIYQERKMCRDEAIKELSRRSGVEIEIIEAYDINFQEGVEEKAEAIKATTEAQGEAIKKVEPDALISAGTFTSIGSKKNVN